MQLSKRIPQKKFDTARVANVTVILRTSVRRKLRFVGSVHAQEHATSSCTMNTSDYKCINCHQSHQVGSPSCPALAKAVSQYLNLSWWNKTLWYARALLRDAYNVKRQNPTDLNVLRYTELKSKYQRLLRRSKDESWKEFCSSDLNDDLFGALKKLAIPSNIQIPSALKVDNVILQDPKSILSEFGKSFFPANPAPTAAQAALERSVE